MRIAVLDDYHRVFETDPAIARLRERATVDVFTEKLPTLDRLREHTILIALRERTRFDAAFFSALPQRGDDPAPRLACRPDLSIHGGGGRAHRRGLPRRRALPCDQP